MKYGGRPAGNGFVAFACLRAFNCSASSRTVKIDYKTAWNELSDTEARAMMHVAGYTDEERLRVATGHTLDLLGKTIGIRAQDTMLEIGCGVGRVGREVAGRVHEWIGCDVAPNMLKHAAKRLEGLTNVRLVPISGYDLAPILDASVDAVYCTVVFMHLEEWDRFAYVREAHRILRPGGRFVCDNANLDCDDGWKVFSASAAIPPGQRPSHISRCSTTIELRCYLQRAGFHDVVSFTEGPWVIGHGVK